MQVTETAIPGVLLLTPRVFEDERGFFLESYNRRRFEEIGLDMTFVQDNHSKSVRNVLRGLHYQTRQIQGKLVRVIAGEIFDVAVDLRRDSPTLGKWVGGHAIVREPANPLGATRFCPRILDSHRLRRSVLQDYRLLRPGP